MTTYTKDWKLEYTLKKFNMTKEEYQKILKKQNCSCYICNKHKIFSKTRLHIDHDHKTNKFRGILCKECNLGIGQFKDNITYLEKAIEYLEIGEINNE